MGDDVDADAVNDAETALDFVFFFAIVVCNILLAVRVFSMRGFLDRSRHCVMLSLAVGTLVVALFSYITLLRADIYFRSNKSSSRPGIAANCTLTYYLPFAYTSGLMALGLDIATRRKWQWVNRTQALVWNSSLAVIVTWALGVPLVFSLVFSNIDWDGSKNQIQWKSVDQFRATVWVCVILPSVLPMALAVTLRLFLYTNGSARGGTGRLYNAVTDSQTFQSLSYKGQYAPFGLHVQHREEEGRRSRRRDDDNLSSSERDEMVEELKLNHEMNMLLVCGVVVVVGYLPWSVFQFLQTYHSYQPLVSTVANMVFFYLGQCVPVVLPIFWLCSYH